jgi:hypothetical protein
VSIREVACAKFVLLASHPIRQIKLESGPMTSFVLVRKVPLQIDTASIGNVPSKRPSRQCEVPLYISDYPNKPGTTAKS